MLYKTNHFVVLYNTFMKIKCKNKEMKGTQKGQNKKGKNQLI